MIRWLPEKALWVESSCCEPLDEWPPFACTFHAVLYRTEHPALTSASEYFSHCIRGRNRCRNKGICAKGRFFETELHKRKFIYLCNMGNAYTTQRIVCLVQCTADCTEAELTSNRIRSGSEQNNSSRTQEQLLFCWNGAVKPEHHSVLWNIVHLAVLSSSSKLNVLSLCRDGDRWRFEMSERVHGRRADRIDDRLHRRLFLQLPRRTRRWPIGVGCAIFWAIFAEHCLIEELLRIMSFLHKEQCILPANYIDRNLQK